MTPPTNTYTHWHVIRRRLVSDPELGFFQQLDPGGFAE